MLKFIDKHIGSIAFLVGTALWAVLAYALFVFFGTIIQQYGWVNTLMAVLTIGGILFVSVTLPSGRGYR